MMKYVWVVGIVCLGACSSTDKVAPDSVALSYRASAATLDGNGTIVSTVTVQNNRSDTVNLQIGGCPVSLRFYGTPDKSGNPAYDSHGPCFGLLLGGDLAPGDSIVFTGGVGKNTLNTALQTSGTYYVTAVFTSSQGTVTLDAGTVTLPITP